MILRITLIAGLLLLGTPALAEYTNIPFQGGGGGGAVSSVFSRTGDVTPQTGDYNITQITNGLSSALTSGRIFVGSAGGVATGVAMGGDCTIVAAGTIICTKTNGNSFGTMATQNATSVAITGGTITGLPSPSNSSDAATKGYVDGIALSTTLTSGRIYVGNGSNVATGVALSGDATLANTGAITVSKTGGVAFATSATTDTTNASNISSGTLAAARGGAGTITGALKANGSGLVSQAACSDLSNGSASCSTDTTNASNIASGTLNTARLPSPFTSGTRSGNTTVFGTTSGSLVNGHCASFDASGNVVDSGAGCGGGSTQWTTSGSDIYYATGNVGIGFGSPQTALHVAGTATISAGAIGAPGTAQIIPAPGSPVSVRQTFGTDNTGYSYRIAKDVAGTKTDLVSVDDTGNVGIGTTAPVFSGNAARFLAVNNATTHGISEIGTSGSASTAGDTIGTFAFVNSSLGTTEKRVANITGKTVGATNTGQVDFYTANAGTLGLNASMLPWGQTNIAGEFSINLAVQAGTDITTALNNALASYQQVRLPCGTFSISFNISFQRAGQQLSGCGREGTVLQLSTQLSGWIFTVSSHADTGIRDLTIDLNNNSYNGGCALATGPSIRTKWINVGCIHMTNGTVVVPPGSDYQSNGFYFQSSDNTAANGPRWSELKNCYLEDAVATLVQYNAHPIGMNFADYVTVSGCTSKDIDNGVNTQASNYVTVTGNVFEGNGTGSPTGFGGVRCSNNSIGVTATGNVIKDMPRGLYLGECSNSTFTGNSIINTNAQAIFVNADSLGNSLYGTITGNAIQATCLNNACNYAIELNQTGTGTLQGYTIVANSYLKSTSPVSTAMIGISGSTVSSANLCANNKADITVGGC